ncbi:MAG: redoxin domain-containing protein [Nitrospira sp.]|nr:redoxin domain-containing protein [bacterium]MBL7048340.1 redoxin domain-containing protein [Nitrospira sp.]
MNYFFKSGDIRNYSIILFLILLTAFAGPADAGEKGSEMAANHPWIGKKAPLFELKTIEGRHVSLSDYLGKKNVVLHFAATW